MVIPVCIAQTRTTASGRESAFRPFRQVLSTRLNALEKAEIEKAKNGITYKEKLSDAEIKKDLDDILT
jgi:hypothetical protein